MRTPALLSAGFVVKAFPVDSAHGRRAMVVGAISIFDGPFSVRFDAGWEGYFPNSAAESARMVLGYSDFLSKTAGAERTLASSLGCKPA